MSQRESWVDRQIREAQERGAFDNLPGAGQKIPGLGGRYDPDWWVKGLIEREDLHVPLPGPLALRKEIEDLPTTLDQVRIEAHARELVVDLNRRVADARRRGMDGLPLTIPNVNVEAALEGWRQRRASGR